MIKFLSGHTDFLVLIIQLFRYGMKSTGFYYAQIKNKIYLILTRRTDPNCQLRF